MKSIFVWSAESKVKRFLSDFFFEDWEVLGVESVFIVNYNV